MRAPVCWHPRLADAQRVGRLHTPWFGPSVGALYPYIEDDASSVAQTSTAAEVARPPNHLPPPPVAHDNVER